MTKQRLRQHTDPLHYRGPYSGAAPAALLGGPPTELEIGPGLGELLVARAREAPSERILGLEVRRPYVDVCNAALDAAGLRNARAIYAEAHCDLPQLVEDGSLRRLYLMFPDPWFKRRHHKRRVLTPSFAPLLARKLGPGGELHWASDNAPLAQEIRDLLEGVEALEPVGGLPACALQCGRGLHHTKRGDPLYGGVCRRR